MTRAPMGLRTMIAIAAATVLAVTGAYAQTPEHPPGHKHGTTIETGPAGDVKARIASLDARIAMLRADMRMFVGELKITTMAALLDALVERQTLVDEQMRVMQERMQNRMNHDVPHAPPADQDPEAMCSPFV